MKSRFNLRQKIWIRADREEYLAAGAIIAAILTSYVSGHWHFMDEVNALRRMNKYAHEAAAAPDKKIREIEYTPVKTKIGNKQYYQLDKQTAPSIPHLKESAKEAAPK